MSWNKISLKYKLIVAILLVEILILSAFSFIVITTVTHQQEELIYSQSVEMCNNYANQFDSDIRDKLVISKTLSTILETETFRSRDEVNNILYELLAYNENLRGTYVCYEPNGFDGKDSLYINKGSDHTGRFLSYYYRTDENTIVYDFLRDYDVMEYYQKPKRVLKDTITEPLYYDGAFVLSIVSPVFNESGFSGICGVDLKLDYVNTVVNQLRILDTGYAVMVSNNGVFMSHPTNTSFIGYKSLYDLDNSVYSEIADKIRRGENGSIKAKDLISNKDVVVFFEPVHTDNSSFLLFVPEDEIMNDIRSLTTHLISISILSILFICFVSYILSMHILSPISKIVSDIELVSSKISAGDLSVKAKTDISIDFQPIPIGLNQIIDSVTHQVQETKRVIYGLEQGNLKIRIKPGLQGEFKEMGDALSNFSSILQSIIYDSSQVLFSFQKSDFTREVRVYGNGDFLHLTEGIEHTRHEMKRITEEYKESEMDLIRHARILKESKDKAQKMEKIINNSPVVVFLIRIDRGWPLLYISENIIQWGYNLKDFKTGVITYFDLVYRKDRLHLFNRISEHFYENKTNLTEEYRILTKQGEIRWVETRMQFIRGEGKFVDLQGINLDITERKKAEEQLLKTNELRKKEIHHRIKNNLQVISTMLYLESSKFSDEEILKAFRDSQSRVKSMALVHEELYRSESADLQEINFKSYIEKLVDNLFNSYKTGSNNIQIYVSVIEIYLEIDIATPLGTIINELITNSLKYAFPDDRDGRIWIIMNKIEKGGQEIIDVEIGDDGLSDPEDFEKENGQSLGLQLVFALVEQIEGTITMDFKDGTKYHIYFPLNTKKEDPEKSLFDE